MKRHELLAVLILIPFAGAFVKIDVSKLASTTTVGNIETSTVATATTSTTTNATEKTLPENITTQPSPTTAAQLPSTNNPNNITFDPQSNKSETDGSRPILDDHLPRATRIKISPDHYYCSCDLMVNLCDVNCCCDNDCTDDMLAVFVCNEQHSSIYDFEFNVGLTSCQIKNDLLCVVGKDTAASPKSTFDIGLLNERTKFKWPKAFGQAWSDDENRETYKSGDSVLTFDENTEQIGMFELPYSITRDQCHIKIPVKFLENHESKCLRSEEQRRTFLDEYQTKLKATKILKSRKSNHLMMMEHCTDANSHCLEIEMFDCFNSISKSNCFSFNSTEIHENWVNKEIVIHFRHNFTNILNCTAFLLHTFAEEMPTRTTVHSIKVQFLQTNESMISIHQISGNIGYLQGKPIITAEMVPYNTSADPDSNPLILDYFHPNKTFVNDGHFMKMPVIKKNLCVLNNSTYETVKFGENIYVTCDVTLDENVNVTTESNFTEICWLMQQNIFSFLMNDLNRNGNVSSFGQEKIKISEYGNPKNNTKHWLSINYRDGSVDLIQSQFDRDENPNEFTCQNMILSLRWEFMYASLTVGSFEHQNLIKKIDLEFGTRVDLKFSLNEVIKVPVFADVMFIDLTNSPSRVISGHCLWISLVGAIHVFA